MAWQQVLRESPPDPLTADQAATIRRLALTVAADHVARPASRRTPVVVIGGALVTAVAGGVFAVSAPPRPVRPPAPVVASPGVRHLEFATPGGTRIIWQFNPEFSLRETLP